MYLFYRLIPILVNGMKYSEIDIILLKVSKPPDKSRRSQLLIQTLCLLFLNPFFIHSSLCRPPRGTSRRTRQFQTASKTSSLASTSPAPSLCSMKEGKARRGRTLMRTRTMMTIHCLTGTYVSIRYAASYIVFICPLS